MLLTMKEKCVRHITWSSITVALSRDICTPLILSSRRVEGMSESKSEDESVGVCWSGGKNDSGL